MEQIALRWNDFEENVKLAFKDFRNLLNDVTLYCGTQKVLANRLVLCACSEVFKSMLLSQDVSRQPSPSILLWDTSVSELNLVLDFMYFGEIKVSESRLNSFLVLAERLKVKGLCGTLNNGGSSGGGGHPDHDDTATLPSPKSAAVSGGGGGGASKRGRPQGGRHELRPHYQQQLMRQQDTDQQQQLGSGSAGSPGQHQQLQEEGMAGGEGMEEGWSGGGGGSNKKQRPDSELKSGSKSSSVPKSADHSSVDHHIKQEIVPVECDAYFDEAGDYGYDSTAYGAAGDDEDDHHAGLMKGAGGYGMMVGLGDYQCKLCGKCYKTPGSLKNHRSLYHRNEIGRGAAPKDKSGAVGLGSEVAGGGGGGVDMDSAMMGDMDQMCLEQF